MEAETVRPQGGGASDRIDELQQGLAERDERLGQLQAENAELRQRLGELERRLGLHSGNSGKPPSSDGLKQPPAKPRTRSLRGKSGKPSGGQPGHAGATLRRRETPDRIEDHVPLRCERCSAPLPVTEHRAHACLCSRCGATTRAGFPAGVNAPAQYGPRIAATAVYLQHAHFLPEDRLAQVLQDLFGAPLCAATLAAMSRQAAQRWQGFTERVRAAVDTQVRG